MVKLTFKWTARREEAKASEKDIEALKAESYVFQADFLQDVVFEAMKLYEQVLEDWRKDAEANQHGHAGSVH